MTMFDNSEQRGGDKNSDISGGKKKHQTAGGLKRQRQGDRKPGANRPRQWSEKEDDQLLKAVNEHGQMTWKVICTLHDPLQCMHEVLLYCIKCI